MEFVLRGKLHNLTPHSINLVTEDGVKVDIPSEGEIRVGQKAIELGKVYINSVGYVKLIRKELTEISEEDLARVKQILENGDCVIVSLLTAQKLVQLLPQYKNQILVIGNTIRDEEGRVVGADALALL